MAVTTAADLIIPEVWADAMMPTILGKSVLANLAATDDSLVGRPGDTVSFPKFGYIGDADTLLEGTAMTPSALTMTSSDAVVIEAGKAVELTDKAVATALGSPTDQVRSQLGISIARKIDAELRLAAQDTTGTAPLAYDGSAANISWNALTYAFGEFGDDYDPQEFAGIVIHSKQHGDLLRDSNFISVDKLGANAGILRGQVGVIGTIPVFISDRSTVVAGTPDTYKALLVKNGALQLKYKRRPVVETDRDVLARTNLITTNVWFATKRVDDRGICVLTTR